MTDETYYRNANGDATYKGSKIKKYLNKFITAMENPFFRGVCALGGLALMLTADYSNSMDLQGAIGMGLFSFGGVRFMPAHAKAIRDEKYKK